MTRRRRQLESIVKASVLFAALLAGGGAAPLCTVEVEVENLRSQKGVLHLCLTAKERFFPRCEQDPAAHRLTVLAGSARASFEAVVPGHYALAVVHDENGNSRLDTFAGIPREGVGFSGNPRLAFGPPRFSSVRFEAAGARTLQNVKMRYFL